MKRCVEKTAHRTTVLLCSLLLLMFTFTTQYAISETGENVLAKVDVTGTVDQLGLPVYAHLQSALGQDYALVIATNEQLDSAGVSYNILDANTSFTDGSAYLIGLERKDGARAIAAKTLNVLYDDGRNILVRATEADASLLAEMGFEIEWLSETPIVLLQSQKVSTLYKAIPDIDYNATVAEMMGLVNQTAVYNYTANITGETPVVIGGSEYTISTRHTNSGTSIQKATQYVYEFMDEQGLSVSYHDWTYGSYSNRNVIGEKVGATTPNEIILITAHLDCMPSGSFAPGADDNGSGSVGVMMAAEIFKSYNFEKTVRFVFFTGEEQGLYGSKRYASKVVSDGDNVVAAFNLDMIGWDDVGGPTLRIHTRTSSSSGYSSDMELANTFVDVVSTYGMSSDLSPIIDSDGITASDHSSFWNQGIPAILAIEDDEDDFCDYYHTTNDRLSTLNMAYFTNYIKASIGANAHLAIPVADDVLNAAFTYSPDMLTATFTDTSTTPGGTTITEWEWEFGDGNTSSAQNPTHTYASANSYTVTLTVTNSAVDTDSVTNSVIVSDSLEYCETQGNNTNYEWIAQVDIGSFSNASGATGYSDFTSMVINVEKNSETLVELLPGFKSSSYTEYWRIWIDLNRDGDFEDSGEAVFSDTGSSGISGSFTVPASAVTGSTTMRVSMKYDGYAASCGSFTYGEVEDYTVKLTEQVSGPTASFNTAADGLQVTFTDTSEASGGDIDQWSWDFGDGNSSDLQNPVHTYSSSGTYTVILTVTDSNSNSDSATQDVTVSDDVIEYCSSGGSDYSYEWIKQITVGTYSNPSGAAGYSDFTSEIIPVINGQSFDVTLSPGFSSSSYMEYWKIWIDFNMDGDFSDSGEEVFSANGSSDVNGSILIPSTANAGNKRMRISMSYNTPPPLCGNFTYGEVEDYTISISN